MRAGGACVVCPHRTHRAHCTVLVCWLGGSQALAGAFRGAGGVGEGGRWDVIAVQSGLDSSCTSDTGREGTMLGQGAPNLPSCLLQTGHFGSSFCLLLSSVWYRGLETRDALSPSPPAPQAPSQALGGHQGVGAGAGAARGCSILQGRERFLSWALAPRAISDPQPFMRPCTPFPSHGTFTPGIVPASFCPVSSRGVRGTLQLSSSENNSSLQQTAGAEAFQCLQVEPGCRGREGWPEPRLRRAQPAPAQATRWDTSSRARGTAGTAGGWQSRCSSSR